VDEVVHAGRGDGAFARERGDRSGGLIEHHRLMAVLHQAARDVPAHTSQSYDADLHVIRPVDDRRNRESTEN
jgi:hypothetical protein